MSDFDPGLLPEWAKYENGTVYVEKAWQAISITDYWPAEHDPYVKIVIRDREESHNLQKAAKAFGVKWSDA